MINKRIAQLINYGITRGLIEPEDQYWARNGILSVLGLDSYQEPEELQMPDGHYAACWLNVKKAYEEEKTAGKGEA